MRLKIKTCMSNACVCVYKRGDSVGLIINGFGSRIWMVYVDQCFTQLDGSSFDSREPLDFLCQFHILFSLSHVEVPFGYLKC